MDKHTEDAGAEETVSAAEANRSFSKLLRGVRKGRSYVVTAHGAPVAKLVPIRVGDEQDLKARRDAFLDELAKRPIQKIAPWTRAELYDD